MDPYQIIRWGGIALVAIGILIYLYGKRGGSLGALFSGSSGSTESSGNFLLDVTREAAEGHVDPVIGREDEIIRVTQILTRRRKNNVVLVGDPGVGKTAIVEGLALKIATGDVPSVLKDKKVLVLQLADLLGGTKYRGEFEARVKRLVEQIKKSNRQIILFIDEIHTIMQTKGAEGSMNLSDILKPALARGELQVIGATTKKEYEQYILPDESWERRFQKVFVDEPSIEESIAILTGLKKSYEMYHKVQISDEALRAAVTLSEEYIKGRNLPDKAIDVMDEASAMVNVHKESVPEHTGTLLFGAANKVASEGGAQTKELLSLKAELSELKKKETAATDPKEVNAIRKHIVDTVKKIQSSESAHAEQKDWPVVSVAHIKEVVEDWVGDETEGKV